ncbi:hypothetical protein QNI19_17680 [Cytophagaceae bacterium DM2B3-1]|uniref:Uncharacterized protein n=1 Tax=Xanthocytophaga flava TaxID=3048013 RepID=A0ABT7CM03_9BACT|nr:hypothetical protein [Xanthocytophaga flavus]MDJ1494774.1 hypothetical protein [Xanthocytophaga flavus]
MTLPKKGFRTLTINGEHFVWRVRKRISVLEEIGGPLIVPVQYMKGGQLLLINTGYKRLQSIGNPNLIKEIKPSLIEKCIRKAINEGWRYGQKGKPMEISAEELD